MIRSLACTIGAGLALFLVSPAWAQDGCTMSRNAFYRHLGAFESKGKEISRQDFDMKKLEEQWRSDRNIFVQGRSSDYRLGNQMNSNWNALRIRARQMSTLVGDFQKDLQAACGTVRFNGQCFAGTPEVQQLCAGQPKVAEGLASAQAQAAKYERDWWRHTPVSILNAYGGDVHVTRGLTTLPASAHLHNVLVPGDVISSNYGGDVTLSVYGRELKMSELQKYEIPAPPPDTVHGSFWSDFWSGVKSSIQGDSYEIPIPTAVAGPRG